MYKHILIPTDGSELADKAVHHGVALAKALGAKVTFVTATELFHVYTVDAAAYSRMAPIYKEEAAAYASKTLGAAAATAKAAGVACDTVHVEDGIPYDAIIKTASGKDCDLILMASHGRRGLSAIVLGSETAKVLTHSKIPVLVYR
jgi:nucleotide-binding universal stress UspA family protein